MPVKSIKKLLSNILDDLDDDKLKAFRSELLDRREEPRVRRKDVYGKDRLDIVQTLVSTFTEAKVVPVVVEVLREIGCNEEAETLEREARAAASVCAGSSAGASGASAMEEGAGSSAGASGASAMEEERHFVDKHRTQLIQVVGLVAPLLDELLDHKVVNQESYNKIRAFSTSQDQMRALFDGPLNGGGNIAKDIFYKILMKTQPILMENLKGQ